MQQLDPDLASDVGKALAVGLEVVEAQPLHDVRPLPPAHEAVDVCAPVVPVLLVLRQSAAVMHKSMLSATLKPAGVAVTATTAFSAMALSHLGNERVQLGVWAVIQPVAFPGRPQGRAQIGRRRARPHKGIHGVHADAAGACGRPARA